MSKQNVLNFYNNCIISAEERVAQLRYELDETLTYLGVMNQKKFELMQNDSE